MLVNNPMRKWSKKLNRHFTKNKQNKTLKNKNSNKKLHELMIIAWKNPQNHYSLSKCKLKLQ